MKFITTKINTKKNAMYNRLLNAFENSVMENTNAEIETGILDPKDYPQCKHPKNSYIANSVKLNWWADKIKKESGNICLIDGDTVVLKDVEHVFDQDFDIAYTRRSASVRIPINGGVLFVKPSERIHDFFDKWVLTNNEMLTNRALHLAWAKIYQGINQASFGYMISRYRSNLKIIEVPCSKYNACDKVNWFNINNETHIMHIKSELRQACINNIVPRQYKEAVKIWKKYDN